MTDFSKSLDRWGYSSDRLQKSKYKPEDPSQAGKALLYDPLAVPYSMGFKDKPYSLTYDILKKIPPRLSIISSIIQTRCNQVAAFSAPYRLTKSLGFEIKHKDPGRLTTKGEREMIQSLESFIYTCGMGDFNPHLDEPFLRDDFESFLKKIVRDSLIYDQACIEVVPSHKGTPWEFLAVDASTIRIAAPSGPLMIDDTWTDRPLPANDKLVSWGNPYHINQRKLSREEKAAYVQIINGQIVNAFTINELAFGIRNPRTDISIQGYGYSELEMLINVITSHLYAEEYNRRFFMQGSAPKGMIVFKGDTMTTEQLEGFRREWRANLEGVANSWRTPVMQSEQGVEWIDLHRSNQDMEYNAWVEYLLKISCGVFQIDPAEINFDLAGGVSQTPLFESSSEWKLKASRDKGLKPLLRFLAKLINNNIIAKIDDNFVFDFVGLDELTEQEKHELATEQLGSYMTLNEVRRAKDLPDVEDGDYVLNPTYLQAKTVAMQQKTQEEESANAEGQGNTENVTDKVGSGSGGEAPEEEQVEAPSYSDRFTKGLNQEVLEVSFDDGEWFDLSREALNG